jgi:methylated-DNA-protein-cysteine methyltransferase-like protein
LEAEGVEVTTGRTGEMRVDLAQYGWFPASAPAAARGEEEDEEEEDQAE